MTRRTLLVALLLIPWSAPAATADRDIRKIEVKTVSPRTLKIIIDRATRDSSWPTYHVEIRIPRGQSLVPASEFRSYYSFTRHTETWRSWLRTQPTFGYVLFTRDTRGDALEVRIVELEDKHDYVPSGVNGVYRV